MIAPHSMSIEITTACQARCRACPRTDCLPDGFAHMSLTDVLDLSAQGLGMGVRRILPHGLGEPTLHPLYPQVLRELRALGGDKLSVKTFTNGGRLDNPAIVDAIREYASIVCVSVDGWRGAVMRRMRPGVDPDVVRAGVEALAAPGGRCRVWTIMVQVDGENDGEAAGFESYWRALGVEHCFTPLDMRDMTARPPIAPNPCSRPFGQIDVRVDGTVIPCCRDVHKAHPWGNAIDDGLEAVWRGERAEEFRRAHRAGEIDLCHQCNWEHECKENLDA